MKNTAEDKDNQEGFESRLSEEDFQHATIGESHGQVAPYYNNRNYNNRKNGQLRETRVKSKLEVKNVLNDANNVVVYRSFRSEWMQLFFFCASFIIIGMIAYTFPNTLMKFSLGVLGDYQLGIVVPVLIVAPIFIVLRSIYRVFNTRYVLGMSSIIKISGILSPSTTSTELYYSNVRAIKIDRGLMQRMLGVGSIAIGDLFSNASDIVMEGVSNPVQYKSIIERRLSMLAKRKEEVPSLNDL